MRPLVSVIIPKYNSAAYIAQAVESALGQSYPAIEVIVIDDGSTDESLGAIAHLAGRVTIESQPNQGAPVARNRGIAIAKGKYLLFLDSDDWLTPDGVAALVEASEKIGDRKRIIFGSQFHADHAGTVYPRTESPWLTPGAPTPRSWILLDGPRITCPLHRRSEVIAVGGFQEDLPAGQDYHFHRQLLEAGAVFSYINVPIFCQRHHSAAHRIGNKPKSYLYFSNIVQVHSDLSAEGPLSDYDRRILTVYAWRRGRWYLRHGIAEYRQLFSLANELAPPNKSVPQDELIGGRIYRTAYRVAGPVVAEAADRLNMSVRRFL